MDALTPVDLLRSLPTLMYAWSALMLVWGIGVLAAIYALSKKIATCRPNVLRHSDKYTVRLVAAVSLFMVWYLIQYNSATECATWVAVINVFYTAHLTCMTIDLARWWNSLKRHYTSSTAY